jgi:hypothetical protein
MPANAGIQQTIDKIGDSSWPWSAKSGSEENHFSLTKTGV